MVKSAIVQYISKKGTKIDSMVLEYVVSRITSIFDDLLINHDKLSDNHSEYNKEFLEKYINSLPEGDKKDFYKNKFDEQTETGFTLGRVNLYISSILFKEVSEPSYENYEKLTPWDFEKVLGEPETLEINFGEDIYDGKISKELFLGITAAFYANNAERSFNIALNDVPFDHEWFFKRDNASDKKYLMKHLDYEFFFETSKFVDGFMLATCKIGNTNYNPDLYIKKEDGYKSVRYVV